MYEQSPEHVYDILNTARGKNYAGEAAAIAEIVRAHDDAATTLLDVGCGTGRHLAEFADHGFECVGVDSSAEMLQQARRRLGDVQLEQGDARSFRLGTKFDVVTCLNGTLGYMTTRSGLAAAMATLASHVTPNGLLIVEPWFAPHQWLTPQVSAESARDDGVAVARVSRAYTEDSLGVFEWHCSVATVERAWSFVEVHRLGLFEIDVYLDALAEAGAEGQHREFPVGRGLGIIVATHRL